MSHCTECGEQLNETGYCYRCGAENAPPTEIVMPDLKKLYPELEKPVFPKTKEGNKKKEKPAEKKKKGGLIAVLIAVIAVGLIGGALIALMLSGVFGGTDKQKGKSVQPWEEMNVTIGGTRYDLPCDVKDLVDNGCEIVPLAAEHEQREVTNDVATMIGYMKTADGSPFWAIVELPKEGAKAEEGRVIGICYLYAEGTEFADGVKLSDLSSKEAILDAFGEPDRYSKDGGCVYETENGILELCRNEKEQTELSLYTADATALGYTTTE